MKDKLRIRDLSVGELFKLTFSKILVDFVISFILVLLFIFSLANLRQIFMNTDLFRAIFDIIFNTIIFMIIVYPYSCIVRYLIWRKR